MHYRRLIRGTTPNPRAGRFGKRAPSALTTFDPIHSLSTTIGKATLTIRGTVTSLPRTVRRVEGEDGIALPRRSYSDNE